MEKEIIDIMYEVSQLVLQITPEQFEEAQQMIDEQRNYINPFMYERQRKFHLLAEHNQKMLDVVKQMQKILLECPEEIRG